MRVEPSHLAGSLATARQAVDGVLGGVQEPAVEADVLGPQACDVAVDADDVRERRRALDTGDCAVLDVDNDSALVASTVEVLRVGDESVIGAPRQRSGRGVHVRSTPR